VKVDVQSALALSAKSSNSIRKVFQEIK